MSYLYDGATPWTRSRLRAVKAHGGVAVSVYVVGSPGGMRCANRADVSLARSMGLGVYPNWERAADFFRHCAIAQARQAGVEALAACRDLGFPDGTTVAFSFDYEINPGDYPNAAARLYAAGQGLAGHYRAVAYGQSGFIEYLAAHGQPGPHWLMGSTFRASSQFYPSEVGSPHVAMVQSHDAAGNWLSSPVGGTDINTLTQPARLGAWWPDNIASKELTVDQFTTLQKQIAALSAKVDDLPTQMLTTRVKIWNGSTPTVATLLSVIHEYGIKNRDAASALNRAVTAVGEKVAAVDAAAVAADVTGRVRTGLADLFAKAFGGTQ